MALFQYRAYSESGKVIRGIIDADSFDAAKDRLRGMQLPVIDVKPLHRRTENLKLSSEVLLAFTRDLSRLLQAGLPLYESLVTIEEKFRGRKDHRVFLELCDQLKNGASLSKAIKCFPLVFDAVYLSMVQAAESSGALPLVFFRLTALLEAKEKLRKTLTSAAAYPIFLGIFCLALTLGLLLFAVPMMAELFEGRQMQPLTRFVFDLSAFLKLRIQTLAISFLIGAGILVWAKRLPAVKKKWYELLLMTPLVKDLISQAALTRFSFCLSMLLYSGLSLLDALRLSKEALKIPAMQLDMEQAEKRILEGEKLSLQLKRSLNFPPLLSRMCAIGEETGDLGKMFESFSKLTEQNLERDLIKFTTFLQPALLILLGAVVGMVILAVLMPLTDVQSFLGT